MKLGMYICIFSCVCMHTPNHVYKYVLGHETYKGQEQRERGGGSHHTRLVESIPEFIPDVVLVHDEELVLRKGLPEIIAMRLRVYI